MLLQTCRHLVGVVEAPMEAHFDEFLGLRAQFLGTRVYKSRRFYMKCLQTFLSVLCLFLAYISNCSPCGAQGTGKNGMTSIPHGIEKPYMDLSADPCVDFAQCACGNSDRLHPILPSKSSFEVGDITRQYISGRVRQIVLTASMGRSGRSASEQRIGDFYAACVDADTHHTQSRITLHRELLRTDLSHGRSNFSAELASQQILTTGAFMVVRVMSDSHDARHTVVSVDQGQLGLQSVDTFSVVDRVMLKSETSMCCM
jgi:hypothetical protein